jgi:hypothetical protein
MGTVRKHEVVCSIAVTSQGNAYAQFQRALKRGNPILALDAARELNHVTLEDALSLCLVMRQDTRRYQRAGARWLARYHAEVEAVTLTEIQEVADLMTASRSRRRAGGRARRALRAARPLPLRSACGGARRGLVIRR